MLFRLLSIFAVFSFLSQSIYFPIKFYFYVFFSPIKNSFGPSVHFIADRPPLLVLALAYSLIALASVFEFCYVCY